MSRYLDTADFFQRVCKVCVGMAVVLNLFVVAEADDVIKTSANQEPLVQPTWTDPEQAALEDPDFLIQGEYADSKENSRWSAQVVALGGGAFDVYLLEGGLPGQGWQRGNQRIKLNGKLLEGRIECASENQTISAVIQDRKIRVLRHEELLADLFRIERKSPTLGAKPPQDAIVLFDGSSADAWVNGRIENGLLANNNITSKQVFDDYLLHLEFRTPYKPYARNQQRGNSGIYHQGRFETQVLDSFGLEGLENECGGIYSIAAPLVNACLPPLAWQTYDIDFEAAEVSAQDEIVSPARITVRLNGILVHDKQALPHTTTASPLKTITADSGPLFIQHHKNPVYYRNIWIVPR